MADADPTPDPDLPDAAFAGVSGQDAAVDFLTRAMLAGRLPHGLLFAGPEGVGKATTAAALASAFLAVGDRPATLTNHPDYHVVTRDLIRYHDAGGKSKAVQFSIRVVEHEIIAPAARKSVTGAGKVFVVEEAETMNASAQNALLKTLEEPSGRTLIVLLTDQPGALLPTVRSRCQIVRFGALPPAFVRDELARRGIDRPTADAATALADGSLGVALRWIEDGVVAAAQELDGLLDAAGRGNPDALADLPDWFKSAADAYAEKQLKRDPLGSKDAATRQGLDVYLRLAAARYRRELSGAAGDDDHASAESACARIDAVARAADLLSANVNVPLVFRQLAGAL